MNERGSIRWGGVGLGIPYPFIFSLNIPYPVNYVVSYSYKDGTGDVIIWMTSLYR